MHCVTSRFGYPKYRLSELSLVPISSDSRRSTVFISIHKVFVVNYQTEICNNFNCSSIPKSQRKAINHRPEDSGIERNTQHTGRAHVLPRSFQKMIQLHRPFT